MGQHRRFRPIVAVSTMLPITVDSSLAGPNGSDRGYDGSDTRWRLSLGSARRKLFISQGRLFGFGVASRVLGMSLATRKPMLSARYIG